MTLSDRQSTIAGNDPSVSCGRFLPRLINSTAHRLLADSIIERVPRKGPVATRGFALWLRLTIFDSSDDEAVRNTSNLCHEPVERFEFI